MNLRLNIKILLLFVFLSQGWVFSQAVIPVISGTLPEAAAWLAGSTENLKNDVYKAEAVLDLVQVFTVDSLLNKEKQRHPKIYGWVAHRLLGRYWKYLDVRKRKYIGTISRKFKVYEGFKKEVDFNIFLMPHLAHYVSLARKGFDVAMARNRKRENFRWDNPDYPCPEELEFDGLGYLTVECEVTPPASHREVLSRLFLPTEGGKHALDSHPNFGQKYPSFGLYGAWCMDCNHNCRPEIHPIEWIWWLDQSADRPGGSESRSWMIGLMRDGSERFEDWSPMPLSGKMAVPIVFRPGQTVGIRLEHLSWDAFRPEKMKLLRAPENAMTGATGTYIITVDSPIITNIKLEIQGKSVPEGMRIWLDDFQYDASQNLIMGFLNIAMSVENIYAGRLTVKLMD